MESKELIFNSSVKNVLSALPSNIVSKCHGNFVKTSSDIRYKNITYSSFKKCYLMFMG